ncbi:MAG: hypothetical protein IT410_01255 [Candidatus Doudnabacteria bacterium]|nr:hypothetical protein [Candidatus Doudnabacteria bacterium]
MRKKSQVIQGILFDKSVWSKSEVLKWVKKHFEGKFKIVNYKTTFQVRVFDPKYFNKQSFRVIEIKKGLKLRLAKLAKGYTSQSDL